MNPPPTTKLDSYIAVTGANRTDIVGRRGSRSTIKLRFAIFRALRDDGLSVRQIGYRIRRDHSSVLIGIRRAAEMYATDSDFAALCDRMSAA